MHSTSADGRAGIDATLVKRLISAQFPQWSSLAVTPVEVDGWDNRTYRLGDDMTVRLPTAAGYVPAVAKENYWLPRLAPSLPITVPAVLAAGIPGDGYPFPWSVRAWLPGQTADPRHIDDMSQFAISVAEFLRALQRCDTTDGPVAVGDPACDLVIAWTMFSGESRQAFRQAVDLDKSNWARARGWALWKALVLLARCVDTDHERAGAQQRVIDDVLTDHDNLG